MARQQVLALFVFLTFGIVSSAQETGGTMQKDSADTTRIYHSFARDMLYVPEASAIAGMSSDRYVETIQLGIGGNLYPWDAVRFTLAIYVGLHRGTDTTWTGYSSLMLNCQWEPWKGPGRWKTTVIGTISTGGYQHPTQRTNQTVAGIDVRYNLAPEQFIQEIPYYVVVVSGFGRDWSQNVNQGFFNVGFALGSFACITFDVSSLFTDHNGIMHAGRLR